MHMSPGKTDSDVSHLRVRTLRGFFKNKSLSEISIGEQKIYIFTDNYA